MSSTSNVQDLLVNVFRPTYRYDTEAGVFIPSLVVSNVTEVIATKIKADFLAISDTFGNTYIGNLAGDRSSNTGSNVAVGYGAMANAQSSSNNVALGAYTFSALSNAVSNVALGAQILAGQGQKNVLIGPNIRLGNGSQNILIGSDLSVGDVSKRFQLGTFLYADLSSGYLGVNNPTPSNAFDVSGIAFFQNKVGIQKVPDYTLDVNGSVYVTERILGGNGTKSYPLYSFVNSPTTGMFVPAADTSVGAASIVGSNAFAISASGDFAAIFSTNKVRFFKDLDVSGTFSACNVNIDAFSVVDGSPTAPSMTFTNDTSVGLYRPGAATLGFATGGVRRMAILSNGDVSMNRLLATDVSYSGVIYGTDATRANVIGGVTLCNGYVITSGTTTSTNLLAPGFIRHNDPPTLLDISGGNISNSLTTRSSNFRASNGTAGVPAYSFVSDPSTGAFLAGTTQLAFATAGVQRMTLSNGNVGIGKATPVVALEVVGDVSATTYNGPGGTQSAPHYTFSDDRTTGLFFPAANVMAVTAGGTERMRISNANVGIGTVAPANALDVSGTLRITNATGTNDIVLANGTIAIAGTTIVSATGVLSNAATTSNSIGGVVLNARDISMTGTGKILGMQGTSNQIGGVTFSNFDLSMASNGRILGMQGTSNQIGGVTFSNFDLSMASNGRILGMQGTSNQIGGVTFSNFDLSMTSSGKVLAPILRNAATGWTCDISGGNISLAGTITGTTSSAVNAIGGVTLANSNVTASKVIASAGSAASAGYQFSGEAGTGLWNPSAGILSVTTNGSNRMNIDPTGAFVVNATTSAGVPTLNVFGDISSTGLYTQGVTNTGRFVTSGYGAATLPAYGWSNGASQWGLWAPATNQIAVTTSNLTRLTITDTGRVGIGTEAPSSALDVSGTLRIGAGVGTGEATLNTANLELGGGLNGSLVGGLPAVAFQGRDGAGVFGYRHFIRSVHSGGTATTSNAIQFFLCAGGSATASTAPGTGSTHVMSVTQQGVGIGTTAPGAKLELIGTPASSTPTTPASDTYFSIKSDISQYSTQRVMMDIGAANRQFANYSSINRYRIGFQSVTAGNGNFVINAVPTASATYNADGTEVNRLTIDGTGNVGIGTTNPQYILDVSGPGAQKIQLTGHDAAMNLRDPSASSPFVLFQNATEQGYYASNTMPVYMYQANAVRMCIAGGNVGIGTTSPRTALDISGQGSTILVGAVTSGGTDGLLIQGYSNSGYIRPQAPGSALYLGASNTSSVTITSSAVGINMYPSYTLDVSGTIRGSSNIVGVAVYSAAGGAYTGSGDVLSFSYTPKQTGTPRIVITVYADVHYPGAGGAESASMSLTDSANNELEVCFLQLGTDYLVRSSRPTSSFLYSTTISGATTYKIRYYEGGDDTLYVTKVYVKVEEISTV